MQNPADCREKWRPPERSCLERPQRQPSPSAGQRKRPRIGGLWEPLDRSRCLVYFGGTPVCGLAAGGVAGLGVVAPGNLAPVRLAAPLDVAGGGGTAQLR